MDNNRATSSMWHRLVNIQNYRREQLAYSWLPKRSRNKFLLFSTSKVQVRVTGPHLKFMGALRTAAHSLFGDTCKAEYKVSKDAGFAVDFYFPNEKIAVEIALSLGACGETLESANGGAALVVSAHIHWVRLMAYSLFFE